MNPDPPNVDDFLARRFEQRLQIEQWLSEIKDTSPKRIRSLARQIGNHSDNAPSLLLDLAVGPHEATANMALLILAEMDAAEVDRLIDERLERKSEDEERFRLLAAKIFIRNDPDSVMDSLAPYGDPAEVLTQITGRFWNLLPPEDMAILWTKQFGRFSPEEKLPLLEMLGAVAQSNFTTVACIEAGSGSVEIDRYLAQALGAVPRPDALHVLELLKDSDDEETRAEAARSLSELHASHPDLIARPPQETLSTGEIYEVYIARDQITSQAGVILSRHCEQDSTISFCVVLIDEAESGIVDLWGNTGFTQEEFKTLVRTLSGPNDDPQTWKYEPADVDGVLRLLRKSEAVARQSGSGLPPGLNLWRQLWQ